MNISEDLEILFKEAEVYFIAHDDVFQKSNYWKESMQKIKESNLIEQARIIGDIADSVAKKKNHELAIKLFEANIDTYNNRMSLSCFYNYLTDVLLKENDIKLNPSELVFQKYLYLTDRIIQDHEVQESGKFQGKLLGSVYYSLAKHCKDYKQFDLSINYAKLAIEKFSEVEGKYVSLAERQALKCKQLMYKLLIELDKVEQ